MIVSYLVSLSFFFIPSSLLHHWACWCLILGDPRCTFVVLQFKSMIRSALQELHSLIGSGQYSHQKKSLLSIPKAKEGELCLIMNKNIFTIQFDLPIILTMRWV